MERFYSAKELELYLAKNNTPTRLADELMQDIVGVEECVRAKANASLILCHSKLTDTEMRTLGIGNCLPEVDLTITTGEELWRKRIYVLGDSGEGVILYELATTSK